MLKASNPSLFSQLFTMEGVGLDHLYANGACTFAGVDAGDIYYNSAAVAVMPLQTAAAIVEVVSSSGNDTALGTGARTVRVSGLDSNWDFAYEDFTMAGAVPVVGTTQFIRVFEVEVLTAGTGLTNAGNIDVQASPAGQIWDRIITGEGRSLKALITVPRNRILWLVHWQLTANAIVTQDYRLVHRFYGGAWHAHAKRYSIIGGAVEERPLVQMAESFPAKSDIKLYAGVGGAASVSGHMAGFLTRG